MKLRQQIALYSVGLSLVQALLLTALLVVGLRVDYLDTLTRHGDQLAEVLAQDQEVIAALSASTVQSTAQLQRSIEHKRQLSGAAYIVVTDEQARRLTHPRPELIGQRFIGEDIWPALQQGRQYHSEATGSLGNAVRSFAPVRDAQGQIIGAVVVGYLQATIKELLNDKLLWLVALVLLVCCLTAALAWFIHRRLRKTLMDWEPEQIARKFTEQALVLESVFDAILAIDAGQRILTINQTAVQCLKLGRYSPDELVGQPLADVCPLALPMFSDNAQGLSEQGFTLAGQSYSSKVLPILWRGRAMGQVMTFRAEGDVNELSHQISHLRQYGDMLRMQTHEYANKLNSLAGLLQMGETDKALALIHTESEDYQALLQQVMAAIADRPVAGLILGKFNRARELGVAFEFDPLSRLQEYPHALSVELITILGNLLDNGLRAARANAAIPARISLSISDAGKHIILEVEDSGAGVDEQLADHLFEYGVSQQAGDHGVGLYLVKEIVNRYQGSLVWERTPEQTTLFSVYLPKPEENN